jgi:TolB-like protein/DNA-binding winged helix-turn-helix (wHTH) protein/Tfp pilus assembly protein PilF
LIVASKFAVVYSRQPGRVDVSLGRIKFADFELDPERFELRRAGRPLKLEKHPMDLLLLLAAADGRLVTREEIATHLWGKDVFVDSEHGINTAVRKIRQALDDDSEHPRFIQTVQRRGYRFVATIEAQQPPSTRAQFSANLADSGPGPADESRQLTEPRHTNQEFISRDVFRRALAGGALLLFVSAWPIYRWARVGSTRASSPPQIRSLAVIPLENLSGDPEQEYFADGMTDELITTLAKYKSLRVISRTSVMQYKKTKKSLPEIAKELSVDGLVEGSILRSQGRVRITAQLIFGRTDTHLWAESYESELKDTLQLQQNLARGIAERISLVTAWAPTLPPPQVSANPAARDAYYRGRYYWFADSYWKSQEFFQEAIRQDASYAAAYAGLANTYTAHAVVGDIRPLEAMPLAEAAVQKALELGGDSAEAHHASAAAKLFFRWDWPGAETECRRALELNPNASETHHLLAYILSALNRDDEMVQEDRTATELDPNARPWMLGYSLLRARRFDEALAELQQRTEGRPDISILHAFLAEAYLQKGDDAKAIQEVRRSLEIEGEQEYLRIVDDAYRNGGFRAVKLATLRRAKESAAKKYVSPLSLADLAAGAGRNEEAIHYLEQAFEQRSPFLIHLQHDIELDALHSDSRYWSIVKKMNMVPLK